MRTTLPPALLLILGLCAALPVAGMAQTHAGAIKAAKVEGPVTVQHPKGPVQALKSGDLLSEADTVVTGEGASAVLVFMNGSSVRLAGKTSLSIEQFQMDPLAENIDVANLTEEPSVSQTSLKLDYGELVGNVRKLHTGSAYKVNTPVGAAGIRGTTFQVTLTKNSDGSFTFSEVTQNGTVIVSTASGTISGAAAKAIERVVGVGQSVSVSGTVQADGSVTFAQAPASVPATPTQLGEIEHAAEQINTAVGNGTGTTTFTPTEQSGGKESTSTPASRDAAPTSEAVTTQVDVTARSVSGGK